MKIEARQWVAVWYRCSQCGSQTARTRLTPARYRKNYTPACHNFECDDREMETVERRWYTTFCIEDGISFSTIAGTLEKIGPFKVCDIVQPNIRAFRKWVAIRQAEQAEQYQQYLEYWRKVDKEAAARREHQRKEALLLKEVEAIAYQRTHAIELEAEQIASTMWTENDAPNNECTFSEQSWFDDPNYDRLDEHPF